VQTDGQRYSLRKNPAEARKAQHRLQEKLTLLQTQVTARHAQGRGRPSLPARGRVAGAASVGDASHAQPARVAPPQRPPDQPRHCSRSPRAHAPTRGLRCLGDRRPPRPARCANGP
jgi:hypothetical protein